MKLNECRKGRIMETPHLKVKEFSLREKIENNIPIFFLGVLLSGFLSGIYSYDKALNMLNYKVISEEKLERIKEEKEKEKEQFQNEQKILREDIQELKQENIKLREMYINSRIQLSNLGNIRTTDVNVPIESLEKW